MGSGAFMTGASGTSGSNLMPDPIGTHDDSKFGIGLQVSCVHSSIESRMALRCLGLQAVQKVRVREKRGGRRIDRFDVSGTLQGL